MKHRATPISQKIVLKLDVGLPFEALILKRLTGLPSKKHEEWLRSLVVQGFKDECRELRDLQRDEQAVSGDSANAPPQEQDALVHGSESAARHQLPRPTVKTIPQAVRAPGGTQATGVVVSFAALRKVIG